jgi:hypothetical protein
VTMVMIVPVVMRIACMGVIGVGMGHGGTPDAAL